MSQIALELGPITIHWYGVFFATGFLLGLWTAGKRLLRDGLPADTIMNLGPWMIMGGIVGARFLYVTTYWDSQFAGKPFLEVFMVQKGGLVYYGGFLGALIGSVIYLQLNKLPLWKVADAAAPSIALGHVFGRLGCFMNGCCFGSPTTLPWAAHFPEYHSTGGAGVHPSQVYESTLNGFLYLALARLHKTKQFEGQIFATYLIAYGILRAFVEIFRGDYTSRYAGFLTQGQLLSIPLIIGGIVLYWFKSKAGKNSAATGK